MRLLASKNSRAYNSRNRSAPNRVARAAFAICGERMTDFEDFGHWLDKEIEHVKQVVETEIRPTAEKKLVAALRAASEKLGEFAKEIESRKKPGPAA